MSLPTQTVWLTDTHEIVRLSFDTALVLLQADAASRLKVLAYATKYHRFFLVTGADGREQYVIGSHRVGSHYILVRAIPAIPGYRLFGQR